jgi:hypothetical protein
MTSPDRRRALRAEYEQRPTEAAVYLLRNTATGRALLASALDLRTVRNKLEFARATNLAGALDGRLTADVRQYGIEAFELEVLDTLEVKPEATRADVIADLRALEDLWREKLAGEPLY